MVLDVDSAAAARSTTVTASASSKVATAARTTTSTVSTELATSSTSSTAAASSATVSGVSSSVVLTIEGNTLLLVLDLLSLLGLATRANDEVLILLSTGECLALGELLGGAFVGLANAQVSTKSQTLLGQLGHVLVVGLGLVLLSGLLGGSLAVWSVAESWVLSSGVGCEARVVLRLGVGDGIAGLLIGPFGVTIFSTPALSCLLVMFAALLVSYWFCRGGNVATYPMPVWL